MPSRALSAAVMPDYRYRDAIVSDFERDVKRHPDQLVTNLLAAQYLQRYRERVDVGDLLRAVAVTKQSLSLQPRGNVAAESTMVSALSALHQFGAAKRYADDVVGLTPGNPGALAGAASVDLELGRYDEARRLLLRPLPRALDNAGWDAACARLDELTGHTHRARARIARAASSLDAIYATPAESRAWYHWREGELAFQMGDLDAARADYQSSIEIFPDYWHGYNGLAKLYWARRQWRETLAAATRAAELYPQPETLGYKYDAQVALGDKAGALQTLGLITAIERIGDAQGLSDRLIAVFYADHAMRAQAAVTSAARDLARRDDIYAEDALGWALAAAGKWQQARPHAERAVRLETEDARLQFHAGWIALHCGDRVEARARLRRALRANSQFHPTQADQARLILKAI
jgi:tetratricopeptide (TPR) repeat protein